MKKLPLELADYLRAAPRSELDLEAAKMLEQMFEICEAAREMVRAKTHEHSRAAYAEMVALIKGDKK